MKLIIQFLQTKEAKRALWTMLNVVMAFALSFLVFLAGNNVAWAIAVVPPLTALSQFLTKYFNTKN